MTREELEKEYGTVYDTTQLTAEFQVVQFWAPFVSVVRKADGVKGCLEFQHAPRFYFGFVEDRKES